MDKARKKDLKNSYTEREITGGVRCIRCSGNGRMLLQSTTDIGSLRNRFNKGLITIIEIQMERIKFLWKCSVVVKQ